MTTTKPQPCTTHGVTHRDGTRAAIACAALTAATAATTAAQVTDANLVTVTVEQLTKVRDEQQHLVRQVVGDRHITLVNTGLFGEPIADAHDVTDMEDYYGSLETAAIVLTAELRLEQAAGITHIDDVPTHARQGRHAVTAA